MIVGLIYVFFRKVSVHILCPLLNGEAEWTLLSDWLAVRNEGVEKVKDDLGNRPDKGQLAEMMSTEGGTDFREPC